VDPRGSFLPQARRVRVHSRLATYLVGRSGQSGLVEVRRPRAQPWSVFGCLTDAAGASALLLSRASDLAAKGSCGWAMVVLDATGSELARMCARFALASAVVVLVPDDCSVRAFPSGSLWPAAPGADGATSAPCGRQFTAGAHAGTCSRFRVDPVLRARAHTRQSSPSLRR